MSMEPGPVESIAREVFDRLRAFLGPEEVDLIEEPGGSLTVTTDEWSLQFDVMPVSRAWLAIDAEPEDPAQLDAARREVMPEAVEELLSQVDRDFEGGLVALLHASRDVFTEALASVLER